MKKTIIIILAMVLLPIYVYSQIVGGSSGGGYAVDIEDGLIVNADVNASAAIAATKIADGTVTSAEFQYIGTLSSDAQDQIDLKAPIANATMTGTFQVPSLKGTALSAVPGSPVDGTMYLFTNSSDGGADDPSDVTGTVPYWTIYDLTTTSYIALWDYDGNLLINKTQTRTPATSPAASFAAVCTGGCLYGGTYIVNVTGQAQLPAVAEGMNFCIVTKGAIAVNAEPNANDLMVLDGTALLDASGATNTSTAGDKICFQYMDATGWLATSIRAAWTDSD